MTAPRLPPPLADGAATRRQGRRELRGRPLDWLRRWGAPALLLSWVPVIGDALCVAAGWLRLSAGWSVFFMALGKFARYYVIARIIG